MLRILFVWFDGNPWAYWSIAAVPTVGLLLLVAWDAGRGRSGARDRRIEFGFPALVILTLLAWRWPFLLDSREFNPDESQFIAGANTLLHDPVFWRSTDGVTSGPLNYGVLLPLKLLGLPIDYFTVRLVALLLVSIALLSCYRLIRSWCTPGAAKLVILPAVVFFATITAENFIHYTSEHLPIALFGCAALALYRPRSDETNDKAKFAGAFLAGCLPWAKLQFGPLGAVLVLGETMLVLAAGGPPIRVRLQRAASLLAVTSIPTVLALATLLAVGEYTAFFRGYIEQGILWVQVGGSPLENLRIMVRLGGPGLLEYAASSGICLLVASSGYLAVRRLPSRRTTVMLLVMGVAIYSVFAPHHPWAHYLLLLVLPVALLTGSILADIWPGRTPPLLPAVLMFVAAAVVPLGLRWRRPPPPTLGQLAESWRHPYSFVGSLLRSYAKADDSLAVWGWEPSFYVDSGLRQGIRDPHTAWSIWPSPLQSYYRNRLLADLQRNRPIFFVDAVGPTALVFHDRANEAHEIFPALAAYVRENYRLILDLPSVRIYVRNDSHVSARGQPPAARLGRIARRARPAPTVSVPPSSKEPATLGLWEIDGQTVQMLHPPGRLAWTLNGDEKSVSVQFGVHPRAYLEGDTDGANLYVELQHSGDSARQLYHRHLDPRRVPADRGRLSVQLALPPVRPGDRVIVRSDAGPAGNGAWDWVYLASFEPSNLPLHEQTAYPGFASIPDVFENESVHPTTAGNRVFEFTPPARLTYMLEGTERILTFKLRPVSDGSASDALARTVCRVALVRAGQPDMVVREQKGSEFTPANGGTKAIMVADLPPSRWGDRLDIIFEPVDSSQASPVALDGVRLE